MLAKGQSADDCDRPEQNREWEKVTEKVLAQVYVPVALVIQTKAEFHDHFKFILTKMYESLG